MTRLRDMLFLKEGKFTEHLLPTYKLFHKRKTRELRKAKNIITKILRIKYQQHENCLAWYKESFGP